MVGGGGEIDGGSWMFKKNKVELMCVVVTHGTVYPVLHFTP